VSGDNRSARPQHRRKRFGDNDIVVRLCSQRAKTIARENEDERRNHENPGS